MPAFYVPPVKSVGHGSTCIRDLESDYEVWLVLLELAQDVGHRLRVHEICAGGVQVDVRDNELGWRQWQAPLPAPSQSPYEIACAGYEARRKQKFLDDAVDQIRNRFGVGAVRNASLMKVPGLAQDQCETVPMPAPMFR